MKQSVLEKKGREEPKICFANFGGPHATSLESFLENKLIFFDQQRLDKLLEVA